MNDLKPVDVVIVGFGWMGAIAAMELASAGQEVLALERGVYHDTSPDFTYPKIADELKYSVRGSLYQPLARETVTMRHAMSETALPYRRYGAFLLGNNVGGAGVHWNGMLYRPYPTDLKLRSSYTQAYGASFIPSDMTIADYPVSYEELEPYFARFENLNGTSGKAGNINGKIVPGGNPFEGPRSSEYPTPPVKNIYGANLFADASKELGLHPYPRPSANCSIPFTNEYGVRLGPCNLCGFCENYGCFMYSKGSPQTTILPTLMRMPNFKLRTQSHVVQVNVDSTGKQATGVTYIDVDGKEHFQPARLVILAAFQMHNVRLLLLSGIGEPYDPKTGQGVVGKNFAYQMLSAAELYFNDKMHLNPFIAAGSGGGQVVDDFNAMNFDHGPLGFVGGAGLSNDTTGGRPIKQLSVPPGVPQWGAEWKKSAKDNYRHTTTLVTQGSVMSYKDRYLDLDPTYKDVYGKPLLRLTFDWHDNEYKMTRFATEQLEKIIKVLNPVNKALLMLKPGDHFNISYYQTTHTTGGAIMGDNPTNSVVNRYMQSWAVPNLFVMGASAFPQNHGANPTGLLGGLAYFSLNAIRNTYLKNPGPLVHA